jgi:hypothetical protein
MTPSTDLFDLIKSLTPSEKRYLKLFASSFGGKENSTYMRLFDAIEEMAEYDEEAIKKRFKNELFVRQLSVAKNYLYNVIQKSLIQSNAEFSVSMKMQMQLISVELLFEKGLHAQCEKLVHRLKEQCIKYEDYTLLERVLDWEIRLLLKDSNYEEALKMTHQQSRQLEQRQLILKYKSKAIELFSTKIGTPAINSKRKTEIAPIAKELLKNPIGKDAPILAQYFYYSTLNFYYSSVRNAEERLNYSYKVFSIFNENSAFAAANSRLYMGALNNYCQALLGMNEFKKVKKLLDDLKKSDLFQEHSGFKERYVSSLASVINAELLLHLNNWRTNDAIALEGIIKKITTEEKQNLSDLYLFELNYYLALAFFMNKDYAKALDYINFLVHQNKKPSLHDIFYAARLLLLILHYELDNKLLLNNLTDTTMRYLKRQNVLSEFDNYLIQYLKHQDAKKKNACLNKMNAIVQKEKSNKDYSLLSSYFGIEEWLATQKPK